MKTFFLQIFGLVIVIIVGLMISTNLIFIQNIQKVIPFSFGQPGQISNQTAITENTLTIKDQGGQIIKAVVEIEIADTKEEKSKGLSGVVSLNLNSGMLFLYDKPEITKFWMKGMKIPLDFIWIRDQKIVDLLPNIPPPESNQSDQTLPLYAPTTPINKVLEVNAGFIAKNNIQVGDIISY